MKTYEEKKAALVNKMRRLKAQSNALSARHKVTKRKKDLRKKILLGAFIQDEMRKSNKIEVSVMNKLNKYLDKDQDRKLFDL